MLPTNQSYCSTAYNCLSYSLSSAINCALMPFRCIVSIISTIFCSCCYSSRSDINSLDKIVIWLNDKSHCKYSDLIKDPRFQNQSNDNSKNNQALAQFLNPLTKTSTCVGQAYFNIMPNKNTSITIKIFEEDKLAIAKQMTSQNQWPHATLYKLSASTGNMVNYIGILYFVTS